MNLPGINKLKLSSSLSRRVRRRHLWTVTLLLLSTILFPQPAHAGFFSQIKCFFLQIFTSNTCEKVEEVAAPVPTTTPEKVTEKPLTLEDIQSLIDKNLLTYGETH